MRLSQLFPILLFCTCLSGATAQTFDLQSTHLAVGETFTSRVLFELGRWEMVDSSKLRVDIFAAFLQKHDSLVVEIGVHTDSRGPKNRSTILSQKRATTIADYLVAKGIAPDRLIPKGYEGTTPKVSDDAISKMQTPAEKEAAHQQNRRTEIIILATDYVVDTKK